MSTASPGLSALGQIAFTVSDVERATAFFRDQLGLPFLFAAPPGLAFFNCGGVRLMVTKPQGAGAVGANSILYFKVADIDATYTALQARGVVFERPPALVARLPDHELWLAAFHDPEGNILELMSEKR
ncbi:MAG TPA: VOC family protein [Opitutaceae bacterium]|nr:VOC family protein [Opitutaceae bacterium]